MLYSTAKKVAKAQYIAHSFNYSLMIYDTYRPKTVTALVAEKLSELYNTNRFSQYETVVIQDEQLTNWHKNHHGKAVQHSIIGRVKSKLLRNENVIVLSKWLPTTKLCINCGKIHDKIKLYDRMFNCDCGISEDRDIHSAKTMIWLNKNVGVGRTDIKRVELEALLDTVFSKKQPKTMKHEDSTL